MGEVPAANPFEPSTVRERSEMLEHAIDLTLRGFAVFPLWPGTKRPMFKKWQTLASTDPEQVARWWNATPRANIAIACGPSNLLVIDLDRAKKPGGPRHGQETLARLAAGREIPQTLTVASARGERHLYFRQPEGTALSISTGSETSGLGPLVDSRGHGGYIVAPGSVFEGGTYRVERDHAIAELPSWIVDELTKPRSGPDPLPTPARSDTPVTDRRRVAYTAAALGRSTHRVATAPEGTRNDTLNREAFRLGRLVGGGFLDVNHAVTELRRAARSAGLPPGEAATTIASGMTAGTAHPRSIPDRAPLPQPARSTEEAAMTTTTDLTQDELSQAPTTAPTRVADKPAPTAEPDLERTVAAEVANTSSTHQVGGPQPTIADDRSSTPSKAATGPASAVPDATEIDFEAIWTDVRGAIERAREALPQWSDLNTADDLKLAVEEALTYLSQAPIDHSAASEPGDPSADTIELAATDPAGELDQQIAAVDAALADARAVGIPADRAEWARATAIHDAIHNVWDTIKAAAGSYWAELSASVRLRGLLTTLATRAARAIAEIADAAAAHLEQRGPGVAPTDGPELRGAYLNARGHLHAHAATREWQRIAALWGTVNTLARQAGDPGIRAVIARSADAIAGNAGALSNKISWHAHPEAVKALTSLSEAARAYSAAARSSDGPLEVGSAHAQVTLRPTLLGNGRLPPDDSESLQSKARQVAQLAQKRLAQGPPNAEGAARRTHRANTACTATAPPRATSSSVRREAGVIRIR